MRKKRGREVRKGVLEGSWGGEKERMSARKNVVEREVRRLVNDMGEINGGKISMRQGTM